MYKEKRNDEKIADLESRYIDLRRQIRRLNEKENENDGLDTILMEMAKLKQLVNKLSDNFNTIGLSDANLQIILTKLNQNKQITESLIDDGIRISKIIEDEDQDRENWAYVTPKALNVDSLGIKTMIESDLSYKNGQVINNTKLNIITEQSSTRNNVHNIFFKLEKVNLLDEQEEKMLPIKIKIGTVDESIFNLINNESFINRLSEKNLCNLNIIRFNSDEYGIYNVIFHVTKETMDDTFIWKITYEQINSRYNKAQIKTLIEGRALNLYNVKTCNTTSNKFNPKQTHLLRASMHHSFAITEEMELLYNKTTAQLDQSSKLPGLTALTRIRELEMNTTIKEDIRYDFSETLIKVNDDIPFLSDEVELTFVRQLQTRMFDRQGKTQYERLVRPKIGVDGREHQYSSYGEGMYGDYYLHSNDSPIVMQQKIPVTSPNINEEATLIVEVVGIVLDKFDFDGNDSPYHNEPREMNLEAMDGTIYTNDTINVWKGFVVYDQHNNKMKQVGPVIEIPPELPLTTFTKIYEKYADKVKVKLQYNIKLVTKHVALPTGNTFELTIDMGGTEKKVAMEQTILEINNVRVNGYQNAEIIENETNIGEIWVMENIDAQNDGTIDTKDFQCSVPINQVHSYKHVATMKWRKGNDNKRVTGVNNYCVTITSEDLADMTYSLGILPGDDPLAFPDSDIQKRFDKKRFIWTYDTQWTTPSLTNQVHTRIVNGKTMLQYYYSQQQTTKDQAKEEAIFDDDIPITPVIQETRKFKLRIKNHPVWKILPLQVTISEVRMPVGTISESAISKMRANIFITVIDSLWRDKVLFAQIQSLENRVIYLEDALKELERTVMHVMDVLNDMTSSKLTISGIIGQIGQMFAPFLPLVGLATQLASIAIDSVESFVEGDILGGILQLGMVASMGAYGVRKLKKRLAKRVTGSKTLPDKPPSYKEATLPKHSVLPRYSQLFPERMNIKNTFRRRINGIDDKRAAILNDTIMGDLAYDGIDHWLITNRTASSIDVTKFSTLDEDDKLIDTVFYTLYIVPDDDTLAQFEVRVQFNKELKADKVWYETRNNDAERLIMEYKDELVFMIKTYAMREDLQSSSILTMVTNEHIAALQEAYTKESKLRKTFTYGKGQAARIILNQYTITDNPSLLNSDFEKVNKEIEALS